MNPATMTGHKINGVNPSRTLNKMCTIPTVSDEITDKKTKCFNFYCKIFKLKGAKKKVSLKQISNSKQPQIDLLYFGQKNGLARL